MLRWLRCSLGRPGWLLSLSVWVGRRVRCLAASGDSALWEVPVPIDTTSPRSPGWWFSKLLGELAARQPRLNRLDCYYRGDPDLPEGAQGCRDSYRRFQAKARTNFAQLVVEAVRERMQPAGFRTGAAGDDIQDADAWAIWQANGLDADSALVHRAQLAMGDAYVIVGPADEEGGAPVITPEDPREVVTAHDPIRRRRTVAALKAYRDVEQGRDVAYLYLPGVVLRAGRRPDAAAVGVQLDVGGWEWEGAQTTRVPAVPVVRFANRADLAGRSLGEFEDVMDVLDRINFMVLQRLVVAALQAFRQRAVSNLPDRDADGNEIDYNGIFSADPGALWQLPEGAEMWESQQVDLTPILSAVRHDIQDLAAVTRTPLFYLTPDAANGSAEGASLAREGLVFKTQDRLLQAGESWEQVMSLAFAFAGDEERARRGDMEVIWSSPERFSLVERYDSASKAQAAGVPWRTVMTDVLQFTPQQVTRMEAERATDVLLAGIQEPAEREPVSADAAT
jgi:hypothetical protein